MEALRRFVKRRRAGEYCELCSLALSDEHAHLVELASHRLTCCCDACAVLFDHDGGGYRRVPRDVTRFLDLKLDDAQWSGLDVPVELVFFCHVTTAGRVMAQYPSPAGAMESLLNLDGWRAVVAANPVLENLQPDVEALLVNRTRQARGYYRVPIDQCYRLIGSIRKHWKSISPGPEVQTAIERFFAELDGKAMREVA
jgi:hypothetical protein